MDTAVDRNSHEFRYPFAGGADDTFISDLVRVPLQFSRTSVNSHEFSYSIVNTGRNRRLYPLPESSCPRLPILLPNRRIFRGGLVMGQIQRIRACFRAREMDAWNGFLNG